MKASEPSLMNTEVLLVGGGGHCHAAIDIIEKEGSLRIAGIVDRKENIGRFLFGYPVVGSDNDLPELGNRFTQALITIGQIHAAKRRSELYQYLESIGFDLPSVASPLAYVSPRAKIGAGTLVMHGAIINAGAVVGNNCIINSRSLVEHDSVVEDNCHISTGAIVNGGGRIGRGSFIGSGAVTRHAVSIPPASFVKANSIVK